MGRVIRFGIVLFAALVIFAQAETFAALTIHPFGAQRLDIVTGVTTLADGGEIIVADSGVALRAAFIEYLEGEFIETTEAEVSGRFGTLKAEALRIDLSQHLITAGQTLLITPDGLELRADQLELYLETNIALLSGEVTSSAPAFSAAELAVVLSEQRALLVSPYRYEDGLFVLQQQATGELLQLTQQNGGGQEAVFNATTTINEDLLTLLTPYLFY